MCVTVLPVGLRVRDGLGRRDVPHVRHPRRPGAGHVLARQHHLRHHVRRLQQVGPPAARRLRRLQLQRLGLHEERTRRYVHILALDNSVDCGKYFKWDLIRHFGF